MVGSVFGGLALDALDHVNPRAHPTGAVDRPAIAQRLVARPVCCRLAAVRNGGVVVGERHQSFALHGHQSADGNGCMNAHRETACVKRPGLLAVLDYVALARVKGNRRRIRPLRKGVARVAPLRVAAVGGAGDLGGVKGHALPMRLIKRVSYAKVTPVDRNQRLRLRVLTPHRACIQAHGD